MSQTATLSTPSAPAPAPPPTPTASRTPAQLRFLSSAVLWLGIAFGVAGAVSFVLLALALGRAADSTSQLIRVQQIQTSLLTADASATNAFLVGGLEPAAQRTAYDQAVDQASGLIAEAARAEPADERALSVLNQQLTSYVAAIELARANNRQGFPVGAQYLRVASATLRAQALPVLDNLVAADAERAAGLMDVREAWLFGVVGLLCVVGFAAAQVWLARRFRRRFNPFLLLGSALALVSWVVLLLVVGQVGNRVGVVKSQSYAAVNAAATARIAAFDAKSNESLTLVARGSGASFEKAWSASAAEVTTSLRSLPSGLGSAWRSYTGVHTEIRRLDDGGKWDEAVQLATSGTGTTSNTTFAAFDRQAQSIVGEDGERATADLQAQRGPLVGAAVVALVIGVAAGLLGRRGVAARLREYR